MFYTLERGTSFHCPLNILIFLEHVGDQPHVFSQVWNKSPQEIYFPYKRLDFLLVSGASDILDGSNSIEVDLDSIF